MVKISLLGAATLIAALLVDPLSAFAQSDGYRLYPWCAIIGGGKGGATNCYFSTLAQCRAAASGSGGHCMRNSFYDAYGPYYRFRRSSGRY